VVKFLIYTNNPLSPPSDPVQRRLQSPPAKSNFLAVQDHYSRLMLSGDGIGDRRPIKLVKAEWDAAEVNLPSIIFNP